MEILDMKVPQSPIKELSRQSEDQGPKAVRCGVIRSCDVLVETQTLNQGCIPADTADRCSAAPLQRQHNPTKRLRLSEEVKRRLLELGVRPWWVVESKHAQGGHHRARRFHDCQQWCCRHGQPRGRLAALRGRCSGPGWAALQTGSDRPSRYRRAGSAAWR